VSDTTTEIRPVTEELPKGDTLVADTVVSLRRRERRRRQRDILLSTGTPLVLLVLWQIAASANWIDAKLFPAPTTIVRAAGSLISAGTLQSDLGATVARLLVGYSIGVVAGVAVGLVLGLSRPLRAAFSPLFNGLYAVPSIALLPLLLVIFGIGETAKVLTVVAVTFFVFEINLTAAVRNFDPRLLEAGRAYGARRGALFRHVLLPGTMPAIFTSLRVSIALGLVVTTATEFVAANNGLGYLVWNSWQLFETNDMYVGLVTIALVGVVLTAIVAGLEWLALPWMRARRG
jgi:NitT/TauT family transport system permease protein